MMATIRSGCRDGRPLQPRTGADEEKRDREDSTREETATAPTTAPADKALRTFDVFLSHAGEDKERIAVPLFLEMRKRRLHPFLDKKRIFPGQDGPLVMRHVVERAPIGVFILSPEAMAKKWPFLELECFLSRYEAARKNQELIPPLIIPVFHRLTWQDCGLEESAFFDKFQAVFNNPDFGFAGREATGEISKSQVMKALQQIRKFSGVERTMGGDYALIMETAKVAQKEMKYHVKHHEGWDYFDIESTDGNQSAGSSIARGMMLQLHVGDQSVSSAANESGFSSYDVVEADNDNLMRDKDATKTIGSSTRFSWTYPEVENSVEHGNMSGEEALRLNQASPVNGAFTGEDAPTSQLSPDSKPPRISLDDEIHVKPGDIGPVTVPNNNDVLCSHGRCIDSHPGNQYFRTLAERRKRVYSTSRFRREKRLIAGSIVQQIRNLDPPGRFLKEELDGTWYDIGDAKAMKKAEALLREAADDRVHKDPLPREEIDFELLCKDRTKCSAEELDQIRGERNRMHANQKLLTQDWKPAVTQTDPHH